MALGTLHPIKLRIAARALDRPGTPGGPAHALAHREQATPAAQPAMSDYGSDHEREDEGLGNVSGWAGRQARSWPCERVMSLAVWRVW